MNFLPIVLAGLCLPVAAASVFEEFQQVRAHAVPRTELTIDNDSLLLKRDDGLYTSGVVLAQHFSVRQTGGTLTYGWHIGQFLYSPTDILLPPAQVGPPDHPYAAWLFIGAYRASHPDSGASLRYGVDLGCIGPCAGGEASQDLLHRILRQNLPQGWAKQVRNEVGVVLNAEGTPLNWRWGAQRELALTVHGRFGNIFTDAGVGLSARIGQIPLRFAGIDSTLEGLARADLTAVGYNAALQGGYFSSGNPHTVTPQRLVAEGELGGQWRSGQYGVRASVIRRGNEIRELDRHLGTQNFARLMFSYSP